jgi:transposase
LEVLRDIGIDKLKNVIDASGSSKKDALKAYIEKALKFTNTFQVFAQDGNYLYTTAKDYSEKYDS